MRILIFIMFLVLAAESSAKEVKPGTIKSDTELGLIVTSGNTETTSLKVKIDTKHELVKWRNQYVFDALYKQDEVTDSVTGETDSQTTAQKYFLSSQANYKLKNPDKAIFLFGSYEDDRFSGYDYQATFAAGYNEQLWNDETSSFEYNVGPGYSFNELEDGGDDNHFIVRAAVAYTWQISESAKFIQNVSTEFGSDVKTKSETALSTKINGSLQMKVSFIAEHNSGAPAGTDELDTETAVTLVYSF